MPSPDRADTMKVAANWVRPLASCASVRRLGFATRSTLLRTSSLRPATSPSFCRIASVSASIPRLASIISTTMSASCAPVQADVTMARSSRRRGVKIPGVSTNTSCDCPSIAMPRTSVRVVCTFGLTIVTLVPTSALTRVDLPTFGAPIRATKAERVCGVSIAIVNTECESRMATGYSPFLLAARCRSSRRHRGRLDARPRQQRRGGRLLGGALGAADAFGGPEIRQRDGDAEFGIVVRTGALDLAIERRRQPARLRPFLQHGLRIAQRPRRGAHALAPQPLDQAGSRHVAAVDEHRPDQRLAHVGQDGEPPAPAGVRLRGSELD